MDNTQLTTKARSIARCLSYNEDTHQAAAKHMLLEMAHRLDRSETHVVKSAKGLMLVNALGARRPLTLNEKINWHLLKIKPSIF